MAALMRPGMSTMSAMRPSPRIVGSGIHIVPQGNHHGLHNGQREGQGEADILGRVTYYEPEIDSYEEKLLKPKPIKISYISFAVMPFLGSVDI